LGARPHAFPLRFGRAFFRLGGARLKLEADLPAGRLDEKGLERPALLRNERREQVGAPGFEQLLHLLALDRLLQDDAPERKSQLFSGPTAFSQT
jgi:hypothetical protein